MLSPKNVSSRHSCGLISCEGPVAISGQRSVVTTFYAQLGGDDEHLSGCVFSVCGLLPSLCIWGFGFSPLYTTRVTDCFPVLLSDYGTAVLLSDLLAVLLRDYSSCLSEGLLGLSY